MAPIAHKLEPIEELLANLLWQQGALVAVAIELLWGL